MRQVFLFCFVALLGSACAGQRADRRLEGGPAAAGSTSRDHTAMWAEPAGLWLAGLEGGQPTLTRAQFASAIDGQWVAADSDGDGVLRTFELQAWRTTWFGSDDGWPGLFHFDADSDGAVSKSEFRQAAESIFMTFDKNKDGTIARAELLVEKRAPETRFGPRGQPPGRRQRRGSEPPG